MTPGAARSRSRRALLVALVVAGIACVSRAADDTPPFAVVLGIAQDGGHPQAGCARACCAAAWRDPAARHRVACLGIVDPTAGECWLVDATPDFASQLHAVLEVASGGGSARPALAGILLTHPHIGHYAGLVHLGREVMGARRVPVWAMPRTREFLATSGPWSQLVTLENIVLSPLEDGRRTALGPRVSATPFLVPHRDEFGETVGFFVEGPTRRIAWLPDIDKWDTWKTPVEDLVRRVDVAYLDGTFYSSGEIPGRDPREVPHPLIEETLGRLAALPASERNKIRFLHLNHTNPALDPASDARRTIEAAGFHIAAEMERSPL